MTVEFRWVRLHLRQPETGCDMCLGVPYEVLEIPQPERALVRVGSGTQTCFTGLVDGLRVGDWVLVHAGVVIETITDDDATENLRLIHTITDEPSEVIPNAG
jgi:hydrogenase expression/formation protein HypC